MSKFTLVLTYLTFIGIALIAGLFCVHPGGSKEMSKRTVVLSNIKETSMGLLLYIEDSNDRFPLVDRWTEAVTPFIRGNYWQANPTIEGEEISIAMNGLLDSKKTSPTVDASKLITFFTTPGTIRNAWGGPAGASKGYGESRRVHLGFADGHASTKPRSTLSQFTWRP